MRPKSRKDTTVGGGQPHRDAKITAPNVPSDIGTKIVAFAASNSKKSINKRLAIHAASQIAKAAVEVLDLNDYEMPIYSVEREEAMGIPEQALEFKDRLRWADGIIISFAEYNSTYSSAFKNIFDWISRIDRNIWENKPMLLMSTSPGERGGRTVLDFAVGSFEYMGASTITDFSLPMFSRNFSEEHGIVDIDLKDTFSEKLHKFVSSIENGRAGHRTDDALGQLAR